MLAMFKQFEVGTGNVCYSDFVDSIAGPMSDQRKAAVGAVRARAISAIAGRWKEMLDITNFFKVEFVVEVAN